MPPPGRNHTKRRRIFPADSTAQDSSDVPSANVDPGASEALPASNGSGSVCSDSTAVARSATSEESVTLRRDLKTAEARIRELETQKECAQKEARNRLDQFNSFARKSDAHKEERRVQIEACKEENRALLMERDALIRERDEWRQRAEGVALDPALLEACRALEAIASAAALRYKRGDSV